MGLINAMGTEISLRDEEKRAMPPTVINNE